MPKRNAEYMLEQRGQITKAALRCFMSQGLHKTSLRDICKEAGVSMGALYVHFHNKDQLLKAIVDEKLRESGPLPEISSWKEFEDFLRGKYAELSPEEFREQVSLGFELAANRLRDGARAPHWVGIQKEQRSWYERTLRAAKAEGTATVPLGEERTIRAISSMFSGLAFLVSMDPDLNQSDAFEDLLPVLRRVCGVKQVDD